MLVCGGIVFGMAESGAVLGLVGPAVAVIAAAPKSSPDKVTDRYLISLFLRDGGDLPS